MVQAAAVVPLVTKDDRLSVRRRRRQAVRDFLESSKPFIAAKIKKVTRSYRNFTIPVSANLSSDECFGVDDIATTMRQWTHEYYNGVLKFGGYVESPGIESVALFTAL